MREFEGDAILGLLVAIVDSWSWRFQFVKSPDAILVGRGAGRGKYPIWGCGAEGVHRGSPTLIQFKGTVHGMWREDFAGYVLVEPNTLCSFQLAAFTGLKVQLHRLHLSYLIIIMVFAGGRHGSPSQFKALSSCQFWGQVS